MDCPHCGKTNPAQARFCMICSRSLVGGLVCTTCHTLMPYYAHYCFHCGAILISAERSCPHCGAHVTADQTYCNVCNSDIAQPIAVHEAPPSTLPRPVQAGKPDVDATHKSIPTHTPVSTMPTEVVVTEKSNPLMGQLPPPRPLQEMLPALQCYLPLTLYNPLERRATEHHMIQARDHLKALLGTAKTYLPDPVSLHPQPGGDPTGGLCWGTFLFLDISGFTPLAEQLSYLGQEGAERITSIINDLFYNVVSILYDHGGTLLKFGGDALLGLFPADAGQTMNESALRAVQSASAMQATMGRFAAIEVVHETCALRIKCGISSGPYFAAHIGTPQSMAYITTGHTVNRADQAEGHANPGEVIVTQVTRALLDERVRVESRTEDFYLVCQAPPVAAPHSDPPLDELPDGAPQAQITYLVERLNHLAPYLPAELLPRIVTNPYEVRISPDHRPVTVMFVNYIGVSDLVEDMGNTRPELITRHLNDYFVHVVQVVERYEGALGRIDQYSVGDRLVIFFGAPSAHEDDPVRAVYAALEIQETTHRHFGALQTPEGVYRFRQRIGINTGHLFAGNVGAPNLRQEYTLMGDDINIAARLMSKAEWGEILIGQKTEQQVAAFCDLEDRGELKVKGKEIAIHTFQVMGRREKIGPTRGLSMGESPLVDRDDELSTLKKCGQALLNGRGGIVALIGDSGLGKSRLMRELRGWLFDAGDQHSLTWLEAHAFSFSERVSYWLAVQTLRGLLSLAPDITETDALFTLWEQGEELLGREMAREAIPFLAHLMDLPLEGEWDQWVRELDPQIRQKQAFWAAREFFTASARQRPIVIVLDDLHWADEASLAWVEDLLEVTDHAPLMFCLVFRQRRDKGCWRLRDQANSIFPHRYTEVALRPLAENYSRQLLNKLLPGAEFSPQTLREILDKSVGNPFYLEEVVRALIDSGAVIADAANPGRWQVTAECERITVPDTLQSAIVSRIDRLTEDARLALQMAAVIGRRFPVRVLQSLSQAEAELESWLAQLERSGLIHSLESENEATYTFPDTLVYEVAYESLLVQRRREFHRRVGATLEIIFANRLNQECELLAYHFGRSDDHQRALKYLEMAGHEAQNKFANATAVRHYTDLLALVGEREETWKKRFDILSRRQQVYGLMGRQETRQTDLEEMLALAQTYDNLTCRSDALNGLADLYQWTGRYTAAEKAACEALTLKTELRDMAGQAKALHQMAVVNYYRGSYAEARSLFEKAISFWQIVQDPEGEAWSLMYLGMICFIQGDYDYAIEHHERALQMAQARQDWFQVGIHLTNTARASLRLGEYGQALEQSRQSLEMKKRVGDRMGQGFSLFALGQVYTHLGHYDEGQSAYQASYDLRQQINDKRGMGYCLHGLGLVALGQEQFEQAAGLFQQAYDTYSVLGLKAEMIVTLSYLGQAYLSLGKLDEAAAVSGQAITLLTEQKDVEEVQQVYLNHYYVLVAQCNPSAGEFLQYAYDAMMSQAALIKDPEKRHIFLDQVKINHAIVKEMESEGQAVRELQAQT